MNLPPTYYDVLLRRNPVLFECVEKDVAKLRETGDDGPFGSTDEFSRHFPEYAEGKTKDLVETFKDNLRKDYGYSEARIEAAVAELANQEYFKKALYSFHADYLTMSNFLLYGRKAFYVADNLAERLIHTELNADCDFLRLPFKCSLFVFTSPAIGDALYAIHDGKSRSDAPVSVFVTESEMEDGRRKLIMACFHADHRDSHFFAKRELLLTHGGIQQALRTDWTDIFCNKEDEEQESASSFLSSPDELFYKQGLPFFRAVINTILYLGSNDPDLIEVLSPVPALEERMRQTKSNSKRKKIKGEARRVSALDYIFVGKSVPKMSQEEPEVVEEEAGGEKRRVKVRFMVRGHWRNQSHGPDGGLRRLTWIMPYFKGPDIGDLVNHPYVVR